MKWIFRIFSVVVAVLLLLVAGTVYGYLPATCGGIALFVVMVLGPLYVTTIFICIVVIAVECLAGKLIGREKNSREKIDG